METQVFLHMKSTLRYLQENRIALLCILDIAIILWIIWFERRIQYEPLLDYEIKMGVPKLPLHPSIYNTIIVSIIINTIVVIFESRKIGKHVWYKYNLTSTYIYICIMMFCLLWGGGYLASRDHFGVISQNNTLFQFPIWIFGEQRFTSLITVTSLYISVCFIHLGICLCYLKICIYKKKIFKGNS